MFKQSRRNILISIMAILVCLFLGILLIIYLSSYHEVAEDNYTMLERYAELYTLEDTEPDAGDDEPEETDPEAGTETAKSDLTEPGNMSEDSDETKSERSASAPPDEAADPGSPNSPPAENDPLPESTSTFRLSTFYSVAISDDGDVLATENTNISYADEELESIAADIISSKKGRGMRGNLIYFTMKKDGYSLVAFVDNTIMRESMSTLFRYTLIYGAIAIVLIFFIAIYLAKRIVSPLEESYENQKQFISDAGHELKTPIAIVDANAELLSREIGENTWLSNIQYENDRMGALVTQMLELARTENTSPPMERLNFSRIAEGEALPFESIAFEKELRFACRIEETIHVQGNSIQLRQLIAILLDNALHHCTAGGEIVLSVRGERGNAVLSVINDGKEIPEEHLDKIFERFYRMDPARNSEGKRYGLGLAIAKAIVTAHHGTIRVLCHDNQVEFTVSIPVLR